MGKNLVFNVTFFTDKWQHSRAALVVPHTAKNAIVRHLATVFRLRYVWHDYPVLITEPLSVRPAENPQTSIFHQTDPKRFIDGHIVVNKLLFRSRIQADQVPLILLANL